MSVDELKAVVVVFNAFSPVIAGYVDENAESGDFVCTEEVACLATKIILTFKKQFISLCYIVKKSELSINIFVYRIENIIKMLLHFLELRIVFFVC